MARNTTLLKRQYQKIRSRYDVLDKRNRAKKDKHAICLKKLQDEYDLTYRTLNYIIFREDERVKPALINPNQLQLWEV